MKQSGPMEIGIFDLQNFKDMMNLIIIELIKQVGKIIVEWIKAKKERK